MTNPPVRVGPSGPIADPSNPPLGSEFARFLGGSLANVDILTTPTTLVDANPFSEGPIPNAGANVAGQLYEVQAQLAIGFATSGGPHANNLAVSVVLTLDDASTIEVAIPAPIPPYTQSGDGRYPDGYTSQYQATVQALVPYNRQVVGAELLAQASAADGTPSARPSTLTSNRTLKVERLR